MVNLSLGERLIYKLKKFPVNVTIFRKFQNTFVTVKDKGLFVSKSEKQNDGMKERYFILKGEKKKIPAPDTKFYDEINGQIHLNLVQFDRETYYPVIFDNGEIKAMYDVPLTTQDGKYATDQDGNIRTKTVEKPILNTEMILDNGRIVTAPSMIASKTYDKEHWLSQQLVKGNRKYQKTSFWEKYGTTINIVLVFAFAFLLMAVVLQNFNDMFATVSGQLKETTSVLERTVDALQTNAGSGAEPQNKPPI